MDTFDVFTTFKIIIIGKSGVGKTSMLVKFTDDIFDPLEPTTTGIDLRARNLYVNGKLTRLQIWDTIGQENFQMLMPMYYRGAQGCILVYDVTNRSSFMKLDYWLNEVETNASNTDIVKILVGNKIDMDNREVTRREGFNFARRHNMVFKETSAKTKEGIGRVFEMAAEMIADTPGLWKENVRGFQLQSTDDEAPKKGGWCWCWK